MNRYPSLTPDELVDTKHGLIEPDRRMVAITALYWYDEAQTLQIMLDSVKGEDNGERQE